MGLERPALAEPGKKHAGGMFLGRGRVPEQLPPPRRDGGSGNTGFKPSKPGGPGQGWLLILILNKNL